jgi:single-stranded DNA-binding protein
MRVGVGRDEAVQWVQVAVFGNAATKAGELKKMDRVYVEGTLKLDTWRGNDGQERHGLSVAAFKCERTHNIGKAKPKQASKPAAGPAEPANAAQTDVALDDSIPF